MSERRARAAKRIGSDGRWGGGLVPFGWMPHQDEDGWHLVHHPMYAPILRRMARDLLDGRSLNAIAAWLNDSGVMTPTDIARDRNPKQRPRATGWKPPSVRAVLASRA